MHKIRKTDISFEALNLNDSIVYGSTSTHRNYDYNDDDDEARCGATYSICRDDLTISLDDIYDTISLYDYENDNTTSSRRITWEEWYLKKKIESLTNENKLENKMKQKLNDQKNHQYAKLSEQERQEKLIKWLNRKRTEKEKLEKKLEKVKEKNQKEKEQKELIKKKAEENYTKWLADLKAKESAEKQKRLEQERLAKEREEFEKQKKAEQLQRLKENRKNLFRIREINEKKGVAIVNGKLKAFYDWSTSPQPTFVNNTPWQN